MNRQIIVNKLLKEGFSQKTLVNFSDKQLKTLSSRMLGEQVEKGSVVMSKKGNPNPNDVKRLIDQGLNVELREKKNAVGEELKGGQKKLDKNKNGKLDSQDFKMLRGKKSDVKEEKPSAGLSKDKKSEIVKKAKKGEDIGKKGKGFNEVVKSAKKSGAKDPKAVAGAAMWKNIKREQVEVSDWVKTLAENKFHSMTSKGEIVSMIKNKLHEQEFGKKVKKGHNNVPEFMTYDAIVGGGKEVETPVKPKVVPDTKPEKLPIRRRIYRPDDDEETKPKASVKESSKKITNLSGVKKK